MISRRGLLGLAGASALGAGLGGAGLAAAGPILADEPDATDDVVPFHGVHQAGITTAVQGHLHLAAFDVTAPDRASLIALLQRWTAAAERLTAGKAVGSGAAGEPLAPPDDTGEAVGHSAARLTLTFGVGPSLFDERFGLTDRRPAALADLPAFPGDALEPARCGGDLVVQACADDPQVAVHAIRTLTRLAAGSAAIRWAQLGFGKASATTASGPTPRNLFGFKDGTANLTADDRAGLDEHVWVAGRDAGADGGWMAGGSYLVSRRIDMLIETWDRTSLTEQEKVTGRTKIEGAPLGSRRERDPLDPASLPMTSHVRLAHPSNHGGAQLLRRGYNFVDGTDGLGHLDAGLVFLAYQRDPRTAFVPVQAALARADALGEYLRHTGSSVWAVPPGVRRGGWWGQTLFA